MRRAAAMSLVIFVACTGTAHPRPPSIEDVRQAARGRPNDPDAQRALAEAELLMRDGNAGAAGQQIDRAIRLRPDDISLHYLRAVERELHGHPSQALDSYLEVVRRAARSNDPLAPALAEISAAEIEALDDSVERYPDRVQRGFAPVHASPGRIGDGARSTIADQLIDIAYRRGDRERVNALTQAQRCLTEWRIAGPIGPRHLLGFDRRLPPDADPTLGDRYDYGPGRGMRDTRVVHARGCNVHLGNGPVGGPGTTYAEATLTVPSGGRWVVRVETPNAAELFIDGRSAARLDSRRLPLARVAYRAIELTAGSHRVRVKVSSRHPNPVLSLSTSQTEGPPGGPEIEGEGLLADYASAQLAMSRGDVVAARERLRRHLVRDGSPAFLIAGATEWLNDPLRSSEVRRDSARRLLGWTSRRDAHAWYPRLTLPQLEAAEGRDQAAMRELRRGMRSWPEVLSFPLQLVDYLEQRGWHAEADRTIERALRTVPGACRPQRAALNQARRRQRASDELTLAQSLVRCDARSDALMNVYVRRRQWDEAGQELARLGSLEPDENPVSVLSARLGLAQARGDEAAVRATIALLEERMPQSDTPLTMEVDRLLANGNEQAARARIGTALSAEPESMIGMRRVLRAIGGESPLERHRLDGANVIRRFEASGHRYDEPMVLVLDYTVYRVFEDGSMLELTHNIFRLQSQEAVSSMGEFNVPEDAQMLTLHTVKQDGRRLEPDEIAGKDSISFPNLSPGDYIEYEYVRPRGPPAGYPGGFIGDRFYFRNYETPFDTSQLTVVVPRSMELTIDPRGPAPQTEQREQDGTRVYHWGVTESRPLVQEPGSVSTREFFPSINWGRGATWDSYVESLRDVLADRDVRDPAAMLLLRNIVGRQSATPEQRARRIYAWVLENVEDSNDVFGLAPAMLAARTGNRTRVLRYLLELAGLDAELALVRAYTADASRASLPDDDTYDNLLVRLGGPQPVWLYAAERGAPFGYVPPALAGMDALMLTERAERVRLTRRPLEADLRKVEVGIDLQRDGGARVSVVETFTGASAVMWRAQLEDIPAASLQQQFESQYVSNLLPGGRLRRLRITGREEPEQPLVLRYEVELAQLARRGRSGLTVPPLFRARLGPQFAPIAQRTTTELIAGGLALDVIVRVSVPQGAAIAAGPEGGQLRSVHGARVSIGARREGGALVVRRSYRIPRMRVTATEYPQFARFCRGSDEIESAEIAVRM